MATKAQRIDFAEVSAPATPATGEVRLYAKSDGHLYQKDDAGTETDLIAAASGGFQSMLVPSTGCMLVNASGRAVGAANRILLFPVDVTAAASLTGITIRVISSTGNISMAVYDSSFNRLATTGSIACPAAGIATVSLSYSIPSAGLYYFALSASSNSATFGATAENSIASPVRASYMESAHPAPSTVTPVSGGSPIAIAMVGQISGGWAQP